MQPDPTQALARIRAQLLTEEGAFMDLTDAERDLDAIAAELTRVQALKIAAASALRLLRNQDGAGFGTTKMEGSEFYMWASCVAGDLETALAGEGAGRG